ncbi:diguanylate cyclase [Halomonas nitroreducens]|uniref:Diguanylate cyclase n=2 Tax=Halomonas nitroreducens TaxID=447425 RepID=A0A431V9C1_9GAMM|nr:diguanylate cyclase [Halomonas nitroreducens]RTR07259.1 diguanylate cyclase [Halomonas nitroreducens]
MTWLVVLALLLGFGWQSGESLLEASNRAHLRYEARLIADELTGQVESRLQALQRLAERLQSQQDQGGARLGDELRGNDALLEWFDGLLVADAVGDIQAAWPDRRRFQGVAIADRDYFRHVRAFKRPHVSEPIRGKASGAPLVLFAVPRLDRAGRFEGLVGGVLRLRGGGLFERLDRLRLGQEGFAAVMSASGTFLFHPDRDRIFSAVPDAAFNPWLELALDGWEGEGQGPVLSGGDAYQAYRQIWPADWVVGVALPQGQVMAPLQRWLEHLGWRVLLVTALMLPLMSWLLWLALRPLFQLERQIEAVGQGRRHRVALSTGMQELRQVADTFNRVEVERGKALAQLRDRQAFLDAILASSPVGMFVTDTAGHIAFMNAALVELTGYDQAHQRQHVWLGHIHPDDRQSALDLWQYSMASGEDFLQQFRYYRKGGDLLWLEVHASRVAIDGETLGFVGTVKDITERREEEALRQWEAEHDPLTGLLNRRGFERRLEETLADCRKTGTPSSLILFDLDHFKPINDEGGHALGDEMLRRIAQVVSWEVRRSDYVARQGGDEFAVLLPSCTHAQASRIAESLRDAVREVAVSHQGQEYRVTLSLGVASLAETDQRIAEVIGRADAASYAAKRQGRDRVVAHPAEA